MRRHIVRAFVGMAVIRRIFRNELIKVRLHIGAYGWVRILVYGERRTGVLNEKVQDTNA